MSARSILLVVAGDAGTRAALERSLDQPGVSIVAAADAPAAEGAMERTAVDAVVTQSPDPQRETVGLLHVLQERSPYLPTVAVTEQNDLTAAVELLRQGAFSVVPSGLEPAALRAAVQRAVEHHSLAREAVRLRREVRLPPDRVPLLGRSERMREMNRQVDELAGRPTPVLLTGETGTGRNLVARELHARSPRSSAPFVKIDCAGVAEILLESQLFGHRRGAFPGAIHDHDGGFRLAAGGALFIDSVDHLPLRLQEVLVHALQSGRVVPVGGTQPLDVDVRLTSSSTRSLGALVRAGTFREDLYRRLAGVVLELPPLRERPEDVVFLAEAFAAEMAERFGVSARRFDAEAQEALLQHAWPGNVGELREAVERAFTRGVGDTIRFGHLPPSVRAGARSGLARPPERLPTLAEAEAELVALVLEDSGGNKTVAARRLGIDRKRLYRKIRKYELLGADEPMGDAAGNGDPD